MRVAFVIHQVEYSIPMGVAYCAAALEKAGHECEVFAPGLQAAPVEKEISDYRPAVVGFSVYSGSHRRLIELCARLKRRMEFVSVFGGPHATFFPRIVSHPAIDAVCRGEGEYALVEFVDRYQREGVIPSDVANFTVKKDGKVVETPVRPLSTELDSLPFPDRMLFIRKYPIYNRHGIKHFVAHRGCPYHCTYCFNHAFNRLYGIRGRACFRSRDPRLICDEIELERGRMRVQMVGFVDDCFTLDKEWTLRFCRVYRDRIDLPFHINSRVENLDDETVRALKEANCRLIYLGVESGDEEFRERVLKRRMSNRLIVDRVRAIRRAGIRVLAENLIGCPTETYQGACATLRLNMEAGVDYAAANIFIPYPGLELTEFAVKAGVYRPEVDSLPADITHGSILRFDSPLEKRRILNLRCFFNLAVIHPRLWPLLNLLTDFPTNPVFRTAGDLVDGYYLWKLLPYRISLPDFFRLIYRYLVGYRKAVGPGKSRRQPPECQP